MGRSVTAAASVRPSPTRRLDRHTKKTLSTIALHRDARLMEAHRRKLGRDQVRTRAVADHYWQGTAGWPATWWQLLELREPALMERVHNARADAGIQGVVRDALAQHFTEKGAALDDVVRWANQAAAAVHDASGDSAGDAAARRLAWLEKSPLLRFVRWRERAMLAHPWTVYATEALATYPLLDALLTEQLGGGLQDLGRPAALTAFVGLHTAIFPKVLAWLDSITNLEQRFWKRLLVVAPVWAAIYVPFYQIGTHGVADATWESAASQWLLAMGGTAFLSPVERYITIHARYEERYFLTILRSIIWSAFFSLGASVV